MVLDDASPLPVRCPGCGLIGRSGFEDVSHRSWRDVAMDVVGISLAQNGRSESRCLVTVSRFGGGGVLAAGRCGGPLTDKVAFGGVLRLTVAGMLRA